VRILAPVLEPIITAGVRLLLAGLVLVGFFAARGKSLHWKQDGKHYAIIGIVNSAIPFTLFSFAALTLPAGYSSVLNATAPAFGLIIGSLWFSQRPSIAKPPIRLWHLAAHVSGIPHYQAVDSHRGLIQYDSVADTLPIFRNRELLFSPGIDYHYSTYGYTLLSAVLEQAGGDDYLGLLERYLSRPLEDLNNRIEQRNRCREKVGQLFSKLSQGHAPKGATR